MHLVFFVDNGPVFRTAHIPDKAAVGSEVRVPCVLGHKPRRSPRDLATRTGPPPPAGYGAADAAKEHDDVIIQLSILLALFEGNTPVTGGIPSHWASNAEP